MTTTFTTPEIIAVCRRPWVTTCLVTILWDKGSPLTPLMELNCWFRTLILLLVSWRNPGSEKGNIFYWPTENCSLRFGGNAKLSSLPVLSLWTAVRSSCASSYMHAFPNSRCKYAKLPFQKGFFSFKGFGNIHHCLLQDTTICVVSPAVYKIIGMDTLFHPS